MENKLRNSVSEMMRRVYSKKLTTTTGGNISVITDDYDIYITPSGKDKSKITPEEIARVSNDEILGDQKPSSEYPFHKMIYKSDNSIKAIIHAHPKGIVAFTAVRLLPRIESMYQYNDLGIKATIAKYGLPGSDELASSIAEKFSQGYNSVFLENHGIVIGTSSLEKAYQMLELIEANCLLEINARMIDRNVNMPKFIFPPSSIMSDKSRIIQGDMVDFLNLSKRIVQNENVLANMAVVSERIDIESFAITPSNKSLLDLKNEDIIVIDRLENANQELHIQPIVKLLKEIYKSNNDFNAIIVASPIKAMAYSLTQEPLDTRIIPEGYILLRNIPTVREINIDTITKALSKETPLINVSGNFYISVGKNLLQAYDRLEVLEFGAESLIYAKKFDKIFTISDLEIDKINLKFTGW